ncbi:MULTISPECIES: flavohemoglobin expression-modulating QEGLA motif protein [unclassified Sinorhizobium]|uniref:flavohemoglobin expression-modulating QEGLA motif protein n=1 Tax=unclassified Sinorhizobium TaxID=2613772 RepID=UPI0024C3F979|nr:MULTISPECIES: flavohemoglobin expression-modulating QEGLA motif protein [unclassified Sinorhizobium]MDK1374705.1 flavohemoglobin expression-modulating QEGLA motif protein [Sinorhizobium sp. 6-70]MDK1479111.1 flavohemoglobin expression-modulating QEGLA motif protein [Sinorhizobium sp. 6-117]
MKRSAAPAPRDTADTPDWLAEALASIKADKAVRKDLPDGGRLHIDRALPFLCLHISGDDEGPVAREIAQANASYLVAPDANVAALVIEAVGGLLKRRLGAFMVLEIGELARDELLTDDAPYLPPFKIEVTATPQGPARIAAKAFANAAEATEAKFRTPRVEIREAEGLDLPFPRLRVRFAPIYRQRESGNIYPQLRERLIASIFDAGLQAFAAFVRATKSMNISTHRALGRKAFIDAVVRTDRSIDEVASTFDFLLAVTPINAEAAWSEFAASEYRRPPRFLYRPLTLQVEKAKKKLFSITFDHLEDPVLYHLYREKQQELDLQLSLLSARERATFIEFGRALYGPVEPELLRTAQDILARTRDGATDTAPESRVAERHADCYSVEQQARAMIAEYRRRYAGFDATVEVRDDLPTGLLVSGSRLLIARSTAMDAERVEPILSHEVGVHLLTYFNGSAQGLRLFRSGLAGYEGMQEGLAVFAEFLTGGMSHERLRLIAARVVACAAMLDGASLPEAYRLLVQDHGFLKADAFNVVLRVYRSGGLAKDAIYLRGLLQLLAHLAADGALEPFWMGKIAASHFGVMQELSARGLLGVPAVRPIFLDNPEASSRLAKARAGMSPLDMVER